MNTPCPHCHGPALVLGWLGRVLWLRCRDCGGEFMVIPDPLTVAEEYVDQHETDD